MITTADARCPRSPAQASTLLGGSWLAGRWHGGWACRHAGDNGSWQRLAAENLCLVPASEAAGGGSELQLHRMRRDGWTMEGSRIRGKRGADRLTG